MHHIWPLFCLVLLLFTASSGSAFKRRHREEPEPAAPLQFGTIIRARGCPLSVYYRTSNASNEVVREAFLAPAFCVLEDEQSLRAEAESPKYDPVMNRMYFSVPVTVTDLHLLAEAKKILRPLLWNRTTLEFLQPTSARIVVEHPLMELVWEPEHETGHLWVICQNDSCKHLRTELTEAVQSAMLQLEFHQPPYSRHPISLKSRVHVAKQSMVLGALLHSPSVRPAARCSNLKLFRTLRTNANCVLKVYQLTNKKGQFAVDPMPCYYGNYTSNLNERGGVFKLMLELGSKHLSRRIKSLLYNQHPKSVTSMSVIGAEIKVSKHVSHWSFEMPRLTPDGDTMELRIRCHNVTSCLLLTWTLQHSPHLLRHIRIAVESQLNSGCIWPSAKTVVPAKISNIRKVNNLSSISSFHQIVGYLCVRDQFVESIAVRTDELCAFLCSNQTRCQAFSMVGGFCQLFLFDKCSKNVMDCGCNRNGLIFVKKQRGLQPGKLCTSGFGNDLCGVKYKFQSEPGNWTSGWERCKSESGMAIMTDIDDADERRHVVTIARNLNIPNVYAGGFQTPGSEEPAGGWHWIDCNTPVSRNLWHSGEPNDVLNMENVVVLNSLASHSVFNDNNMYFRFPTICECLSPFE